MDFLKRYEIPSIEVLALSAEDIVTFSQGFDGEEHPLLPNPFIQ